MHFDSVLRFIKKSMRNRFAAFTDYCVLSDHAASRSGIRNAVIECLCRLAAKTTGVNNYVSAGLFTLHPNLTALASPESLCAA